ncbi:hypothetical protein WICPIJ_006574 [Wickerhamomyces pijperi]|uniref:Uncharacterized protein n=1 Tax=Wickerhamomyces pijperi TaxID=599730 RepID=A0A9P8Q1V3_WICPI|nr:hypothetical protein WICPIJ_006574 [Wickerhamomyces pijperi]
MIGHWLKSEDLSPVHQNLRPDCSNNVLIRNNLTDDYEAKIFENGNRRSYEFQCPVSTEAPPLSPPSNPPADTNILNFPCAAPPG